MKPEFTDYLSAIGMPDILSERVSMLEGNVAALAPEEITHIFVSDYVDEENTRQFQNLYFFTPTYLVEIRDFATQQAIEVDLIRDSIINIRYSLADYDFKEASEKSRLNFRYDTGILSADLKASKENCDHLTRTIRECLLPHFRTTPIQVGRSEL